MANKCKYLSNIHQKNNNAYEFHISVAAGEKNRSIFLVRSALLKVYSGRGIIHINGEPLLYSALSGSIIYVAANTLVTISSATNQNTEMSILLDDTMQISAIEANIKGNIGMPLALNQIKNNYTKVLNLEDLAAIANMSTCYFGHKFIETYKLSALNLVRLIRVFTALDIMLNQHEKYVDIANDLGFYDQPHFIKAFKSVLGESPKVVFKQVRNYNLSQVEYPATAKELGKLKKVANSLN